ncbi:MAG: response regulator [Jaaginema sp. PMC 1079.18]|nr:response regulator [Jaaginema sp. PMC 1080.18]MEC4849368.1 response regulator [Jaaginema sp. PMC 1079.18]MEC4865401.1 response regulator [Jaaginema sp. PMC 1078.18]
MTILQLLLIDDNPDDRLLVLRELSREFPNLQAQEIKDAIAFNRALEQGEFNLVITDYQLQWTNGLEILHAIKDYYPNCPIIMFTGTGSEEIAVKAMKAGLDDYVIKSPKHYIRLASAVRLVWERSQQRLALEESEKRYRRLFEGVPVGLYRVSVDGKFIDANQTLVQMLAYQDKNELLDRARWEYHLSDRDWTQWQQKIQTQNTIKDWETQLQRCDRSTIWVRHSARAIPDEENLSTFLYYEGALEDITAQKQAETERSKLLTSEREARATAESANRVKDEFLATLSHELRTPLNAMLGWMQLLRNGKLGSEQISRALEIIERNAKAQAQLIEDLLDVSRIIRGKISLSAQPLQLKNVVRAALDTVSLAAETKQITIYTDYQDQGKQVYGDPERLQQVVWNLLVNAVKFTPEGGTVWVEVGADETSIFLKVADTGIGIDAAVVPYLFERFRQSEGSNRRRHEGLGLGLAIVRHLVELHGGKVDVASKGLNQGATFTITLPQLKVRTLREAQNKGETSALLKSQKLANVKVLLVEDNQDTREFLTLMLEEYGAIALPAESAATALQLYTTETPDIIVSDIGMPEVNGYDFLKMLRDRDPNRQLPIPAIALTAYVRPEDVTKALAAGFTAHLAKPIDTTQFLNTLTNLIFPQRPTES